MVFKVNYNLAGGDKEKEAKDKLLEVFIDYLEGHIPNINKETGTIEIIFTNDGNDKHQATVRVTHVLDNIKAKVNAAVSDCEGFF